MDMLAFLQQNYFTVINYIVEPLHHSAAQIKHALLFLVTEKTLKAVILMSR